MTNPEDISLCEGRREREIGSSRRSIWKICRESAAGAGKVGQPRLNVTSDVTLPEKPFRPGRAFRPSARARPPWSGGGRFGARDFSAAAEETRARPSIYAQDLGCAKIENLLQMSRSPSVCELCGRADARVEVLRLELLRSKPESLHFPVPPSSASNAG